MKSGRTYLAMGDAKEIKVILMEDDKEKCVVYVKDEAEADSIVDRWIDGTYQLLTE